MEPIRFNNIYDNEEYGLATGSVVENNWWGAEDGPSGVGNGSGDALRGYFGSSPDYTPWLTAPYPLAGPGVIPKVTLTSQGMVPVADVFVDAEASVMAIAAVESRDQVVSVKFWLDSQLYCTDTAAPYRCYFSTGNLFPGKHNLKAVATTVKEVTGEDAMTVVVGHL